MTPGGPVAILAGSGRLPLELADHLRSGGRDHRVLAFRGFADGALRRRADAVCDLLDPGAGLAQHFRRALVLELALGRRQLVVDRIADERVHEAQRRLGAQDLGADELAGGRRDGPLGRHRAGSRTNKGSTSPSRSAASSRAGLSERRRSRRNHMTAGTAPLCQRSGRR